MSSGGSSRVSIPSSLKKTIQDLKEIARNHSDEEILAMLEECGMDPNETAQRLLYQDNFHEVRRRRDRRKESTNNKDPTEPRWKPGMQGRGIRGGRGSYYSRHQSHDAGGNGLGKEDRSIRIVEKAIMPSSYHIQETDNKSGVSTAGSEPGIVTHSMKVLHANSSHGSGTQMLDGGNLSLAEETLTISSTNSGCQQLQSIESISSANNAPISDLQSPETSASEVCAGSATTPVPSLNVELSGVRHTTKYEMVGQQMPAEPINGIIEPHDVIVSETRNQMVTKEMVRDSKQGLMTTKSLVLEVTHLSDASQPLPSTFQSGFQGSKQSPSFSNRPQGVGFQKVGLSKEWKPKSVNPRHVQSSVIDGMPDDAKVKPEIDAQHGPVPSSKTSGEAMLKVQKKLEDLCFKDTQHVIIPDHLQVPEAERCGLSFGSFDANFGIGKRLVLSNEVHGERLSTTQAELPQEHGDKDGELILSTQNLSLVTQEEQYPQHHPETSSEMPESPSSNEAGYSLSNSAVPELEQPKEASAIAESGPQFSLVHTTPPYSAFGLAPPMLGNQVVPFGSSENQGRESSQVANFIAQPPFEPSMGYYTQMYRPGADGDGRFSPLLTQGATDKHAGNTAVLSSQPGQSTQENSFTLPSTGVSSQATGVMQTSVPVAQQPLPFFRQPAGVHISPYPPNYVPYGHYISPFYVPAPTIHHFFSNTALPQQQLVGSVYPPPVTSATSAAKYSHSQYKSGNNNGNLNQTVMPVGHGSYSSSPTGYGPSPAVSSSNSTVNEDHAVSQTQYKESSVYMTGQQGEGSAVWLPVPGREMPSVQASSFYNLPQGQQMTFTPQAGNGAFAGIYHPTQAVGAATVHPMLQASQTMTGTVEMVGPAAGVYQQPQRAQINWPNNY